jgi:periplasmic copper chaperone A
MSHRAGTAATLVTALLALAACGDDDGGSNNGPVTNAWARPTPDGATTGAVYLAIEADEDDALIGVSIDPAVAGGAELHQTFFLNPDSTVPPAQAVIEESDEVTMQELSEIEVPGGVRTEFDPLGPHVMLVDLVDPLEVGETFDLTVQFTEAGEQVVPVEVLDLPL